MNGSCSGEPSACAAASARVELAAHFRDRAVAHQPGDGQRQLGEHRPRPPPRRGRRRAPPRGAPRSSSTRRRRRRRRGCGGRAPPSRRSRRARRPKPCTKPCPTRPLPPWRSMTAIFSRSRDGSATALAVAHRHLLDEVLASRAGRGRGRSRARAGRRRRGGRSTRSQSTRTLGGAAAAAPARRRRRARRCAATSAPPLPDQVRPQVAQVAEDDQVGATSGRDRAAVGEAEPLGGVERRHADRVDRVDAGRDRQPDQRVDVPFVEQVGGRAVVGARSRAGRSLRASTSGSRSRRFCALVASRMRRTSPRAASRAPPRPSRTRGRCRARRRRRR